MARRLNSMLSEAQPMVTQLNTADTRLPGRGLVELVEIILGLALLGIALGGAIAAFRAPSLSDVPSYLAFGLGCGLAVSVVVGFLWFMLVTDVANTLVNITTVKQPPPARPEAPPNQPPAEESDTDTISGIPAEDVKYFVSRVLLWKAAEEADSHTSWRQALWRKEILPVSGQCGDALHKRLTSLLEAVGVLVDYDQRHKGRLTTTSYQEIMGRLEQFAD